MASAQDLPFQDPEIQQIEGNTLRELALNVSASTFGFARFIGFRDVTESCHGPLSVFLDDNPKRFKLILMPRDHYKSSVVTIAGNLRLAVRNPNHRILIANESSTNAERFLRSIREICEQHRAFRTIFSHVIPKNTRQTRWNDQELQFIRTETKPEPTFDTIGMTGAFTSRHYTHMCFDDLISEEAIKSPKVMKDTINRMSSVLALLEKPELHTFWIVGTRWALHDIYSHSINSYGDQMARFSRGAIEDGQPIFPELMSLETLALKRRIMGEYKFSCLMMNNPRNEELQDLDTNRVRYWRFADAEETLIELLNADGSRHRLVKVDDLDITATVDLAPAEKTTSDRNAITTCGITKWDEVIVLDQWAKRCTPLEVIEKLFAIERRFHPSRYGIEGVAYQKAFKYFLRQEAERRGLWLSIVELKAIGKKEVRVRGLQPILALERLYVHPTQQLLMTEMADFPLGEHDDTVDSLSMQLQMWPGRLSPDALEAIEAKREQIVRKALWEAQPEVQRRGLVRSLDSFDPDEDPSDWLSSKVTWTDHILR